MCPKLKKLRSLHLEKLEMRAVGVNMGSSNNDGGLIALVKRKPEILL